MVINMKKTTVLLTVMIIVFMVSVFTFFTANMAGSSAPNVSASENGDLVAICIMTNTDIVTGETDWDGAWLCIAIAFSEA